MKAHGGRVDTSRNISPGGLLGDRDTGPRVRGLGIWGEVYKVRGQLVVQDPLGRDEVHKAR